MNKYDEWPKYGPDLIDLPPGYAVRKNDMVGYEFLDGNGDVVTYHPKDDKYIRRFVWDIWRRGKRK